MLLTPEWLSAIATAILVIATIFYVIFTYRLTKETIKLREIETTPFMSLYIQPDHLLKLIIENIGKAPAYNVEFIMDEQYSQCFSCGCDFKNKIPYFSPNQQLTIGMDTYQNLAKFEFENIPIKVKYSAKDGSTFEETFIVEWKYLSSSILTSNYLGDMKKELEKITKELKNISTAIKK